MILKQYKFLQQTYATDPPTRQKTKNVSCKLVHLLAYMLGSAKPKFDD